jgi:hypothetical protein
MAFADFGCSKPNLHKNTHALNVLQFIEGSTSKGRESLDSSKTFESVIESTVT